MNPSESVDQLSDETIDISSEEFSYLDSDDCWLSTDPNQTFTVNNSNSSEDIALWIRNAFNSEKSRGTHMTLINKLDELKLMSPSVDSRTFTRKRNIQKRQSIFNGGLSSLCSPVNEDDYSSPEANDRTFEVQTTKKTMNGTFSLKPSADTTFSLKPSSDTTFSMKPSSDSTFTLSNEEDIQLNNIDDVEKIAKKQEDSLRESCSNGWSPPAERSPTRNQTITNRMNATINSNTLTKSRDINRSRLENELNSYHMNGNEDPYYANGLSPEDSFRNNVSYNTSTPLVPKYRNLNLTQEINREPIVPKIMPDVSNLRTNSSYSKSKIGKSEPNLSQRLQPMYKGLGYNSTKTSHLPANRAMGNPLSNNFLQAKVPSDSRLLVKNGLKLPQNQTQNVGRMTSPPPSQSQQQLLLNRKVAVEGELNRMGTTTAITTNLCRKSTFRVRDYAINSEENLKENGYELCLTNTSASTNGYKTNKTNNNNNVHKNVSKIPGPKPIRSGIPVSGQRTAIPCPTNHRPPANHTDNWSNGCY